MLSIRVDSIESTRIVSPVVDSSCQKLICKTRLKLRCNVRIESNRKVPQTNRLSVGVLDMDEPFSCLKTWLQNLNGLPIIV